MESHEISHFITDIYSRGTLMLAIGIGHDMGLFEVLINAEQPLSLKDIADRKNLKERYTKEWLSAMVVSGIIHQDRETNLYTIPETHSNVLKLRSSFAPILSVLANRTEQLKRCFHKDGPLGFVYGDDPAWFSWFNNYRSTTIEHTLSQLIPGLEEQGISLKLESGIKVLDIGCGTGNLIIGLSERFPMSHFTGLDYSEKALKMAYENSTKTSADNIMFVHGDAHNLSESWVGLFDLILVYDTLHDMYPSKALDEIYRVLKDDGYLSLLETGFHSNPVDNVGNMTAAMYYCRSLFECLPTSLSGGAGEGYGLCWGVEEIEKAIIGSKFKIHGKSRLAAGNKVLFSCKK